MTFLVTTLGCKVNQADSDALVRALYDAGFSQGVSGSAHVVIVNTCTVTHVADKKSRQAIARMKAKNPDAIVVAMGCMLVSDRNAAASGADILFDAKRPVSELVQELCKAHPMISVDVSHMPVRSKTRAFIKVQDGCNNFCSYCIVPYVRGTPTSRAAADVYAEVSCAVLAGAKEVVLTGVQLGAYESPCGVGFADLVRHVCGQKGVFRVRLSSILPNYVTPALLAVTHENPILCDSFHLPLQSGCNKILALMNRDYTCAEFSRAADALRVGNTSLTTDIMVAHPGESDRDFLESVDFVQKMGFMRLHVFEYSMRPNTAAAQMCGKVPSYVAKSRSRQMRELADKLQQTFLKSQIHLTSQVLFEKFDHGRLSGYSTNYCKVFAEGESNIVNTIQEVRISHVDSGALIGQII